MESKYTEVLCTHRQWQGHIHPFQVNGPALHTLKMFENLRWFLCSVWIFLDQHNIWKRFQKIADYHHCTSLHFLNENRYK